MSDKPKFEIVDLGVHHPGYFQGFGVSYTQFEHCTYGIGDTAEEAYQDALDSVSAPETFETLPEHCPFGGSVEDGPDEINDYRPYYHVGIRWNTFPATPDAALRQIAAGTDSAGADLSRADMMALAQAVQS